MKGSTVMSCGARGSWVPSTRGSLGLLLRHQRDVQLILAAVAEISANSMALPDEKGCWGGPGWWGFRKQQLLFLEGVRGTIGSHQG